MELYLKVKEHGKDKVFFRNTERNICYLKSCIGVKLLDQYSAADASKFRQWLLDKGLSSGSLKRIFYNIKAVLTSLSKSKT